MSPLVSAVLDVLAGRPLPEEVAGSGDFWRLLHLHGRAGLAVAEGRGGGGGTPGLERRLPHEAVTTYRFQGIETTLVLESGRRALLALGSAGIPALPFKGLALFQAGVYSDPGARIMEDADVLVPPGRVPDAIAALQDAGFRPWSPWEPGRLRWLSSFSLEDVQAPGGVAPALALHWATPYARLRLAGPWPTDPLWEGADGGVPTAEAHFAVIAEHVLKHLRVIAHLRGVADLVRLTPLLEDGEALVRQARRRGSLPGLRTVLAFLDDFLGVRPCPEVLQAVAPGAGARKAARKHLDPVLLVDPQGPPGGVQAVLGAWGLIGTSWASLREWVRVALPSGAWLQARYPSTPWHRRRLRYGRDVLAWVRGRGRSPLSPNQELDAS